MLRNLVYSVLCVCISMPISCTNPHGAGRDSRPLLGKWMRLLANRETFGVRKLLLVAEAEIQYSLYPVPWEADSCEIPCPYSYSYSTADSVLSYQVEKCGDSLAKRALIFYVDPFLTRIWTSADTLFLCERWSPDDTATMMERYVRLHDTATAFSCSPF
jgi:hypothetical protein